MKKEFLCNNTIKVVDSSLLELEATIKQALKGATYLKQIFEVPMQKGMAFHSANTIKAEGININYFNGYLIINTKDYTFCMGIDEGCDVTIQRPQPDMRCRLFFNDFNMWIVII